MELLEDGDRPEQSSSLGRARGPEALEHLGRRPPRDTLLQVL